MTGQERKNQDRWMGIAVIAIGAYLLYETFFFHEVDWVPLGMAFWPRMLLGCLGGLSVYFIVRGSLDEGPFGCLAPMAFVILAGCLGYVLLIETIGWLVLTPVFIFALTLFLSDRSKRSLIQAAMSAVFGTIIVYFVFHYGLDVQLPDGLLEVDA